MMFLINKNIYLDSSTKKNILEKYEQEKNDKNIDKEMVAVCEKINKHPDFVVSSCCFGHLKSGNNTVGYINLQVTQNGMHILLEQIAPKIWNMPIFGTNDEKPYCSFSIAYNDEGGIIFQIKYYREGANLIIGKLLQFLDCSYV